MNHTGHKVVQTNRTAISKTRVDGNFLPFNPPELTQPLSESLMEMWVTRGRGVRKITYPECPLRVLRLAGDRRGKQAPDRHAAEKSDEISPPHAMPPDLCECQSIRWLTSALKQVLQRKSAEARQSVAGQGLTNHHPCRRSLRATAPPPAKD